MALSKKKQKELDGIINRLRKNKDSYRKKDQEEFVNPVKASDYDEIYDQGLQWLNSIAGPELNNGKSHFFESCVFSKYLEISHKKK